MSLVHQGKPARHKSFWVDADVQDQTYDLYTCPANCSAEVEMVHIVNADGNANVFVYWYIAPTNIPRYKSSHPDYSTWIVSGYTSNLLGGKNMTSGEFIQLTDTTLVLEPGDKVQVLVTNNATPHIDVLCTVTETFSTIN